MAAAGARAAGRRAGAQSRDLRSARHAADRVGQRPVDDRSHRAAVDVVARGTVLRHVALAAARPSARVCSAPQRRMAMIACACANRSHPGRAGTSCRRSWPRSSTATSRARSRSPRLHARAITSAADASGGYNGLRTLHCSHISSRAPSERHRRNSTEESGRGAVCVMCCVGRGGSHMANGCGKGSKAHATVVALCTHAVGRSEARHSAPTVPRVCRTAQWIAQRIGAAGCARRMQQCERSRGVGCGNGCAR